MQDLIIKIQGSIQESNFDEYKEQLLAEIKKADKSLSTDEDFIEASELVKSFKTHEKALKCAIHACH